MFGVRGSPPFMDRASAGLGRPSIGTCEDREVGLRSSLTRIGRVPALKTRGSAQQEFNLFRSSGNSSCDPSLQEATMPLGKEPL